MNRDNKYNDPNYKSDFDKFCEEKTWSERFDEILADCSEEVGVGPKKEVRLKSFISQLLDSQRAEIVEEIKKINKPMAAVDSQGNYDPEDRAYINGFEQAIFDIILLTFLTKETK